MEAVGTHYCSTLHVRVTVQTVWDADQDEPGCTIVTMCPPEPVYGNNVSILYSQCGKASYRYACMVAGSLHFCH